jgi:hypothetical protein
MPKTAISKNVRIELFLSNSIVRGVFILVFIRIIFAGIF